MNETETASKGGKKQMKKRVLAIMLAILMALTLIGGISAYLFR
ncbi:MAG TPA: hypothetical protein PK629_01300 [Oscillospiraceae bacterium]|nr:hypothetical protein [Oscillospiraceae bacterium]HPK36068.1 hypothetical protein [Oscillospiraceae bacterium]HPR76587.1 hypothetical protein [Oscillospiraceae bacterium]